MGKLENLTEKLIYGGHTFYGIWEKYISTLKSHLNSGLDMTPNDRRKIMEFISNAYAEMGEIAESIAWKARAMGEAYAAESEKYDEEEKVEKEK